MILNLTEIINIIVSWSISGIFLSILIYFLLNPEKVEKWGSIFAKLFSFFSIKAEKFQISKDIQSKLNLFRKEINRECENLIPCKTEIKFINPLGKETIEHKEKKIIIILKNRKNQDENLVRAAVFCVENTLIPYARRYIEEHLRRSIDLQFIKNFIFSKDKNKLNYYIENYLNPELKRNNFLKNKIRILEKLSNQGIFTRILLKELKNYGLNFYSNLPQKAHFEESNYFFDKLRELAEKKKGENINPTYNGQYIKMSIVLIGRFHTIFKGFRIITSPYIKWIYSCEKNGIKSVYLLAWRTNIFVAEKIAKRLDQMPERFQMISKSEYLVKIKIKKVKAICMHYQILKNV